MAAKLTPEQKAKYLSVPNQCPFCESHDISGGLSWQDLYTLSDVDDTFCNN